MKKVFKKQARQGDIYFEIVSNVNVLNMKPRPNPIIAYGEVTGHCHQIMSPSISECESYIDEEGDIYVKSDKEITVTHDTHGSITLPANEWLRIFRQREYDPLSVLKERKVAD